MRWLGGRSLFGQRKRKRYHSRCLHSDSCKVRLQSEASRHRGHARQTKRHFFPHRLQKMSWLWASGTSRTHWREVSLCQGWQISVNSAEAESVREWMSVEWESGAGAVMWELGLLPTDHLGCAGLWGRETWTIGLGNPGFQATKSKGVS